MIALAPDAETEEQARQRQERYEAQQKAYEEEEQSRAEERRQRLEQEQKEHEAEIAQRDELRKHREATFERIVQEAPPVLTAQQLRVILRALVNLDPYTFADDLAADISEDPDNDRRSAEEVLLATIEGTTDDKLTSFAARLAFSGHRAIVRDGELDFLAEAEAAFLAPKPKKSKAKAQEAAGKPTLVRPTNTTAKKPGTKKKNSPTDQNEAAA